VVATLQDKSAGGGSLVQHVIGVQANCIWDIRLQPKSNTSNASAVDIAHAMMDKVSALS
jgi:hypothetical protein